MSPLDGPDVLSQLLGSDVDDAVVRAMSAPERRYVCYYLLDHDRATLDELVDVVADWFAAAGGDDAVSPARRDLSVDLYHRHLPLIADADLAAFDPDERVVASVPLDGQVRDLIQVTYLAERPDDDAGE